MWMKLGRFEDYEVYNYNTIFKSYYELVLFLMQAMNIC